MITLYHDYRDRMHEGFVNLFQDDMHKYATEVWDILQTSYAPIGGFLSAPDVESLIAESWLWKLVKKGGKVIAVSVYKNLHGRKLIGGGSDGTPLGKQWLFKILEEDIQMTDRNAWIEASGALEHKMLKLGGVPVPNSLVGEILNKEILNLNPDGFHYTRLVAGKEVEKMLIGNVK
jgi:hypothetical protein